MSAPVTFLARKWRVDVNTGTSGSPVWVQVKGINSVTPSLSPTMQDNSDFDTDGWGSDVKTMLKWSLSLSLIRKGTTDTTPDAGQEALRAKADQFGAAGLADVRWYDRKAGSPEAYRGTADVSWEPAGGGTGDLETVTVNLSGQGARTSITNPAV